MTAALEILEQSAGGIAPLAQESEAAPARGCNGGLACQ